jgi:ribosomal protein S18 acetylase RimI-like enzyme
VTELRVRRAEAGDAALVSRLNADVHAVHAAGLPERFKPPGPGTFPPSMVVGLLGRAETLIFLAYAGADPVGYVYAEVMRRPENAIRYDASMVYIHHISVSPDYHGQGIGKALLGAVRAAGREAGIERIGLDVWMFNDGARSFFRSQGFVAVREALALG